ncbi:MAG: hypothetical protein ABMA25_04695 [Ilumatobacteraceae bacterium]
MSSPSRVLVVAGSEYSHSRRRANTVLADVTDPGVIAALASALVASPSGEALMTPGDPTIVILDGRELLNVVHVIGEGHIRCAALWDSDAMLEQPTALSEWLRRVLSNPAPASNDLTAGADSRVGDSAAFVDSIELLSDPVAMRDIERARRGVAEGRMFSGDEIRAKYLNR